MKKDNSNFSRRDFLKSAGAVAAVAAVTAVGLPALTVGSKPEDYLARVVLVRHPDAVGKAGKVSGPIIQRMLDDGMKSFFELDDPIACWKKIIKPDDTVGLKSNEWGRLTTTTEVEQAIKNRVMDAGVPDERISIDDRRLLGNPIFKKATALINARPMRTHAWAGVGSLIKNYIMFAPNPADYHDNSCASLGAVWNLPICKGKTRLNVLVLLTPLFYGVGAHHFDPTYSWHYNGLLIGTDPVALDAVGLRLFQIKRKLHFGEDKPMQPTAHHIQLADTKYKLGTSDLSKIELVKIGWDKDVLI